MVIANELLSINKMKSQMKIKLTTLIPAGVQSAVELN